MMMNSPISLQARAPSPLLAADLRKKVLIVDDEPAIVQVIEQALGFKGYTTRSAADGDEALRLFQEDGDFDVIITDLMLPTMSGLELLEGIKALDSKCEVLVLTGFGSSEKAVEAMRKGAYDYLKKPTNIDELFIAVDNAFQKKKMTLENLSYQLHLERLVEERSSELLNMQKFLHSVLEASTEYFIIASDPPGQIVLFNSGAEKLFGYQRGEVQGKKAILFFPTAPELSGGAPGSEAHPDVMIDQIHQVTTRDGREITVSLTITPILSEASATTGYIWIGKDIGEQLALQQQLKDYASNLEILVADRTGEIQERNRELEETVRQLKNTQMQLLQSEKLATIGQLAAGVAHEINNPIGFINSNLSTLKKYILNLRDYCRSADRVLEGGGAETIEELRQIKKFKKIDFILDDVASLIEESTEGTERVKTIVQDLKDFSHQDRGKLTEYDINKGIKSTLNIVWNELKYKAEVIQELGDLPLVRCYPQQLNQVFMNLLVNAAHAINNKGQIWVRSLCEGDQIIVEVADDGMGIPAENIEKIFEPFFTTKETGKGTGLGLSVSYGIVSRHGGDIGVESQVGLGTTFRVRLPIHGPNSASEKSNGDAAPEAQVAELAPVG